MRKHGYMNSMCGHCCGWVRADFSFTADKRWPWGGEAVYYPSSRKQEQWRGLIDQRRQERAWMVG